MSQENVEIVHRVLTRSTDRAPSFPSRAATDWPTHWSNWPLQDLPLKHFPHMPS